MWLVGQGEFAASRSGAAGAFAQIANPLNERSAVAARGLDTMCEKR
jgi:hypothetical protein